MKRNGNILIVASSTDAGSRLQSLLSTAGPELTIRTCRTGEISTSLRGATFSLVVLDLDCGLEDPNGLQLLKEIALRAPETPLLTVVRGGEDAATLRAVRESVTTYVTQEELATSRFQESVRYALDRNRRAGDARKEGSAVTPPSLSRSGEGAFGAFIVEYEGLLERSLNKRAYKALPDEDDLEGLARRLGTMGAGPRDVIDIHTAVLKKKFNPEQPTKYYAYAQEARLLLLELMGYLVGFYRTHALAEVNVR